MFKLFLLCVIIYDLCHIEVLGGTCKTTDSNNTLYVDPGESVMLPCGILPNSTRAIIWEKFTSSHNDPVIIYGYNVSHNHLLSTDYSIKGKHKFSTTDMSLTIMNINQSDFFCYRCDFISGNRTGFEVLASSLTAKPKVKSMTLQCSDNISCTGLKEGNLSITCNATFDRTIPVIEDISFILTRDDVNITNNGKKEHHNNSITFKQTVFFNRNHGNLQCYVILHHVNSIYGNQTLGTKEKNITLKFPPLNTTITVSPSGSVTVGTSITVTCMVSTHNPVGSVVWTKGGSTVSGSNATFPGEYHGKKIMSNYTFVAQKSDNGLVLNCTPVYKEKQLQALQKRTKLDVLYPPEVNLVTSSDNTTEESELTMTCNVTDANPLQVNTYNWSVEYKYNFQQIEEIPVYTANYTIKNISYSAAGVYNCTAANNVGQSTGSKLISILYAPKDRSSEKYAFTEVKVPASITFNILSYPAPIKQDLFVKFKDKIINTTVVVSALSEEDHFLVNMTISNVTKSDFGNYTFVISNGIGFNLTVTLELRERGPPEAPYGVTFPVITAHTVIISWISGHSGGYNQKFQIYFKEQGNLTKIPSISDPGTGSSKTYMVKNLKKQTTYSFKVTSQNGHTPNNESTSSFYNQTTLDIPIVQGSMIARLFGTNVIFTLPDIKGNFTHIAIIRYSDGCGDSTCAVVIYNVTLLNTNTVTINGTEQSKNMYNLSIHQHHEQVFNQGFELMSNNSNQVAIIGAVCGILAVFATVFILILFVLFWRKRKASSSKAAEKIDSSYEDVNNPMEMQCVGQRNGIDTSDTASARENIVNDVSNNNTGEEQVQVSGHADETNGGITENGRPSSYTSWISNNMFGNQFAHKNKNGLFVEEYNNLPEGKTSDWSFGSIPELKPKNRFKNILPYDYNRVLLEETDDDLLSAYINASYIKDLIGDYSYIAASGVTTDSIPDFWRMIWEQNISAVVMVTNLKEKNKSKCELYWPVEGTLQYGDISVKLLRKQTYPDYEIKQFSVSSNDEQKNVLHYHYTGWPDHGVPQNASGIFKIRDAVKQHRTSGEVPVLVHCSAGVGRTGTFIAIDILMDQAEYQNGVDVYKCVEMLRQQRIYMVQTLEQYMFIHLAIYEAIEVGNTSVACAVYKKYYLTASADSVLDKQYQLLNATKPEFKEQEVEFAVGFGNHRKNRDPQIVPSHYHCVNLLAMPDEYINAVYVDGYKTKKSFLATQVPFDTTIETFWRMIYDQKCSTIVCLEDDPNGSTWCPPEHEMFQIGGFIVANIEVTVHDNIETRTLALGLQRTAEYINITDLEEKHDVKMFYVNNWANVDLPNRNISTPRKVYADVQQWHIQQHRRNPSVTTICLNGADNCGLFIGACCLFDMANAEQEVDIFHMVKQIRTTRPQFFNTIEQYIHLHDVVQEYISQFGEYANFS